RIEFEYAAPRRLHALLFARQNRDRIEWLALREAGDLDESALRSHPTKRSFGEIVQMMRIAIHRRRRRYGRDQHAPGLERFHPSAEKRAGIGHVLDGFQAHDIV